MNEIKTVDVAVTNGVINFNNFEVIKQQVIEKTSHYANLVVKEEDVKQSKNDRASLNALSKSLNDRRKEIKKAFEQPYKDFDLRVKEIDGIIKEAIENLDTQVKKFETNKLDSRTKEMKAFYDEQIKATTIDFLTFESVGLNVTLSASTKSLKTTITDFIDGVKADLELIETQPHKERILLKYHKTLDVKSSISTVLTEIEREAEIQKQREEREARLKEAQEKASQVQPVLEVASEPVIVAPEIVEEPKILSTSFTVYGTIEQLKALKQYMEREGLKYE